MFYSVNVSNSRYTSLSLKSCLLYSGSPGSGVPQKYRLGAGKIDLMSPEEQTLSDASVDFKDGKTVMKFTKPLVEPNQVPFVVGNNQMLWAYGSSPTISYHAKRSPFSLDLTASSLELNQCNVSSSRMNQRITPDRSGIG